MVGLVVSSLATDIHYILRVCLSSAPNSVGFLRTGDCFVCFLSLLFLTAIGLDIQQIHDGLD